MKSMILPFTIWLHALLPFHPTSCTPLQHVLNPQPILRNATMSDVDSIATVIITAFEPIPNWRYIYQFRKDFPEEHHRCYRNTVSTILSYNNTSVQVIEAPADSNITVAAAAIWAWEDDLAYSDMWSIMSTKCTHKDLNVTRAIDWMKKAQSLKKKYFDDYFGPEQLYLDTLVVHPDYQLHGAGTRLVNVGIEVGRKVGRNVTLLSQPTAEGFYLHRGFREVQNISLASVDGDETFGFNVMAYNFSSVV